MGWLEVNFLHHYYHYYQLVQGMLVQIEGTVAQICLYLDWYLPIPTVMTVLSAEVSALESVYELVCELVFESALKSVCELVCESVYE